MVIKNTNKIYKMLEYFFNYPTKSTYPRELARITGISHTWISNMARELQKEGLLKIDENLTMTLKANKDATKFKREKRVFNLKRLLESDLVDYLADYYEKPHAIILFGSYCYGEDIENSDIDIAVITERKGLPELGRYEKLFKRRISLQSLSEDNISDEFKNTLANGIVLYGFMKLL